MRVTMLHGVMRSETVQRKVKLFSTLQAPFHRISFSHSTPRFVMCFACHTKSSKLLQLAPFLARSHTLSISVFRVPIGSTTGLYIPVSTTARMHSTNVMVAGKPGMQHALHHYSLFSALRKLPRDPYFSITECVRVSTHRHRPVMICPHWIVHKRLSIDEACMDREVSRAAMHPPCVKRAMICS